MTRTPRHCRVRLPALLLLLAVATFCTLAVPGAPAWSQPAPDSSSGTRDLPAWLGEAWMRLSPPVGWKREPVPAGEPVHYALRYVRVADGQQITLQWRMAQPGESRLALLAERQQEGWQWTDETTEEWANQRWAAVEARRATDGRTRLVRTAEIHSGRRVVLVAESAAEQAHHIAAWFSSDTIHVVSAVDGCDRMVAIPGEDRAVPLPSGFEVRDDLTVAGTISAVRRDLADDGDSSLENATTTRLIAAVVRGPQHHDLDAAFGPVERQFEQRLKLRRSTGRPTRVTLATRILDAFVCSGTVGDARPGNNDDPATPPREFIAWYVHDPVLHRLLVLVIECDAGSLASWRAVLDTVVPRVWWPAPPAPQGVAAVELSGELLTVDGRQQIAQLNLVLMGADGKPVTFEGADWSAQWTLMTGSSTQRSNSGTLNCNASGDCLANGLHGEQMQLDLDTALRPPRDARIVVIVTLGPPGSSTTLTVSQPLTELFGQ